MIPNPVSRARLVRAAMILGVAVGVLASSSPAAAGEAAGARPSLVGTWMVQVTLRDCTTSAPVGAPFNALVTFHRDRTVSETAASVAFAPGQRTPGHGAWAPKPGHRYAQEMIALVVFDTAPNLPGTPTFDPTKPVSPGFFAGWQTVSHTVRFTGPDRIASSGTNRFYKTTGELYRSGCSTAVGQRFE